MTIAIKPILPGTATPTHPHTTPCLTFPVRGGGLLMVRIVPHHEDADLVVLQVRSALHAYPCAQNLSDALHLFAIDEADAVELAPNTRGYWARAVLPKSVLSANGGMEMPLLFQLWLTTQQFVQVTGEVNATAAAAAVPAAAATSEDN